jgi:hypothetical protein
MQLIRQRLTLVPAMASKLLHSFFAVGIALLIVAALVDVAQYMR